MEAERSNRYFSPSQLVTSEAIHINDKMHDGGVFDGSELNVHKQGLPKGVVVAGTEDFVT